MSEIDNEPEIPMSEFSLGARYGEQERLAEIQTILPCSRCGELWSYAWGSFDTFVCPDCLRAASESIGDTE